MFHLLMSLTAQERNTRAIRHALGVRQAVADVDYHMFFRLQEECPNLGGYLMGYMVPKMRHQALLRICKSYRPSIEVQFVLKELGFGDESEEDLGRQWLLSCACVLTEDGTAINSKDSVVHESDLEAKKSAMARLYCAMCSNAFCARANRRARETDPFRFSISETTRL